MRHGMPDHRMPRRIIRVLWDFIDGPGRIIALLGSALLYLRFFLN